MSEYMRGGRHEYLKQEQPTSQGEVVFENVYDQLKKHLSGDTPIQKGERFLAGLEHGAQFHVTPIEEDGLTNKDIYAKLWKKIAVEMQGYLGVPKYDEKRTIAERAYTRVTRHINRLVKAGEVSPRAAKVFAHTLPRMGTILTPYGNITATENHLSPAEMKAKNNDFVGAVQDIWNEYPDEQRKEQEGGGFLHFNNHLEGKVTLRYYISADIGASPEQVINTFKLALAETGLQDNIYFKVPEGLSSRQETIVIYQKDSTSEEDVERLIRTFKRLCSKKDLSEKSVAAGIPVTYGISLAAEPKNLNEIIKLCGEEKKLSYNSMIASLIQLSFELALTDESHKGQRLTPKKLKPLAKKHFGEMLLLSGINPDTMIPNKLGGELPEWVVKLQKEST